MKKLLPIAILAVVVLLCSASTVTAWIAVSITPDEQITSTQISEFWFGVAPCEVCHDDKTVTYTVTVETDSPPASVSIIPGDAPASWFSWLDVDLPYPYTTASWPLDIKIPQTVGTDAGGLYTITVVAVDSWGSSAQATATLEVQNHDYVSETLLMGDGVAVLNEDFKNMGVAVKVKRHIDFNGTVECLTKNEYLMVNAKGKNTNYEQESVVSEYSATLPGHHLIGDERFKSCAVMGGTGAKFHELYAIFGSMESRCANLNHHMTGDMARKTELCTYNNFTQGYYLLEQGQSIPCTRSVSGSEEYIGNLTVARHLIYRRAP